MVNSLVFVLNSGSSSLKFQLNNVIENEVLVSGLVERIGIDGVITIQKGEDKFTFEEEIKDHKQAIQSILNKITNGKTKIIDKLEEIGACGHRVVHGGEDFNSSVIVTPQVIKKLKDLCPLAPLHNPANIMGIEVMQELLPNIKNVAVFDTAFHQTMPKENYLYAIPYEDYEKHKVRRYGFHGTSHYYVSQKMIKILEKKQSKIIVCHLGNGSSVCAVKDGKSIETSMGLTPLEGLVMGTRSGDIDPGVIAYLADKKNLNASEVVDYLNKKSGLLGLSEISSDLRDVLQEAQNGNEKAQTALNVQINRIKKYIASYAALMGGVDAICFTAGIGENASYIRNKVIRNMEYMGIHLNSEANEIRSDKEREISTISSPVKVYVIPTNEEYVIAKDTYDLVK